MIRHRLVVILATVLLTGCQKPGTARVAEVIVDSSVWRDSNASGSLIYRGDCQADGIAPRFPLRYHIKHTSSPVDALRDIFAENSKMQITQEPSGMIRISETDVPQDVLNIRIRQVDFDMKDTRADGGMLWSLYSGNRLLWPILEAPEVRTFMDAHKVHPLGWKPGIFYQVSGPPYSDVQHVKGRLENVTVSQALDRVAQTFPGMWVYRECTVGVWGDRIASFDFFDNSYAPSYH